MKKIKIRFVKRSKDYLIQRKNWLGLWKYIGWTQDFLFCKDSKEELLNEVLENYYKTDRRFVSITEYPQLILY